MNNQPIFNLGFMPKKSNLRNDQVTWYNVDRLYNKAISMFEWINLPPTIDERYLEIVLCTQGHICFFKDEELDVYLALQCTLGVNLMYITYLLIIKFLHLVDIML